MNISMNVINVALDGAIHEFALHIEQVMEARFKRENVGDAFSMSKVEIYSDDEAIIEKAMLKIREYLKTYDILELNFGSNDEKILIKM